MNLFGNVTRDIYKKTISLAYIHVHVCAAVIEF